MKDSDMADFLKECIDSIEVEPDSVEEFQEVFCSRCMNEACKHSEWDTSSWMSRMNRQEQALYNPEYGNPSQFKAEHSQDFISYENDDEDEAEVHAIGWESWDSEDMKVHKEDPPTEEKSSEKIDQNLESLKDGNGEDKSSSEQKETQERGKSVEEDGESSKGEMNDNEDSEEGESEKGPRGLPDQSGKVIEKEEDSHSSKDSELLKRDNNEDNW
jgi:hypothetical protein